MKSLALLALRWIALAAFAVWFGGFTFYSSVVIPILHDELGGVGQGEITGQVSRTLNFIGVGTVAAWWLLIGFERSCGRRWAQWGRVGLLAVTTAFLMGLIVMHPILDAKLGVGSIRDFYRLHQIYLIACSVQWGVNLAILAITLVIWRIGEPQTPGQSPEKTSAAAPVI